MSNEKNFQWTDELVKEFSEYVGLRVNTNVDIRQQINYLQEDFKSLHSKKEEPKQDIEEEKELNRAVGWLICNGMKDIADTIRKAQIQRKLARLKLEQKEEPKDWEILKCWEGSRIDTIHDYIDGQSKNPGKHCLSEPKPCDIFSVKRLSDGSVFSIGDEFIYYGQKFPPATISEIKFYPKTEDTTTKDEDTIVFRTPDSTCSFGLLDKNVQKVYPKPLPKEEPLPIKVHAIHYLVSNDKNSHEHTLMMSDRIPLSKYEALKKAIENCLNGKAERMVPYASYKRLFDQNQEILEEMSKMKND